MSTIVLLRHGQSVWNEENRFTGWTDIDLSEQGVVEANQAADQLLAEGLCFDLAFTSVLKRAIRTLWIVLDQMDLLWIPVMRAWQLNERHYGALQGLNKAETAEKYGPEQVFQWRRSYAVRPPALEADDPRHPRLDCRYTQLDPAQWPSTESLQDTCHRVLPYWEQAIVPHIQAGKRVIVSAHGNSLRALVKHLDGISDEDIPELNIPTGIPLLYELDRDMRVMNRHYLGDPDAVQAAAETVARQSVIARRMQ